MLGAGFAGLAAADELNRAGVRTEVLEARDRVGGRVWSAPFAGAVVERGAEFVLPDYAVMRSLVERLGLSLIRKGTLYGYREPRGGEPVTMDAIAAALGRVRTSPAHGGTLAAALAALRLQPAVAEAIRARIEVSTTYPADELEAATLEGGAGSFGHFDTFTVAGGNQALATALAGTLATPVHLGAETTHVAWTSSGGVRVSGPEVELAAEALVLAVPATVIGRIMFDPPLPEPTRAAIGAVRFGHAAKLFVGLREPAVPSAVLSVPERYWCYTQLGADGEPLPFLAAFAGTASALERLEVARGPDRWLESVAKLRPDLSLDPGTVMLATWSEDPWVGAAYSASAAGSSLRAPELRERVGPIALAGEHTAGRWHGLMEGALRSGIAAARKLLGGGAGLSRPA